MTSASSILMQTQIGFIICKEEQVGSYLCGCHHGCPYAISNFRECQFFWHCQHHDHGDKSKTFLVWNIDCCSWPFQQHDNICSTWPCVMITLKINSWSLFWNMWHCQQHGVIILLCQCSWSI